MDILGNTTEIRKSCVKQKTQLWKEFDRIRGRLTEISRCIYPLGIDGLTRSVEDVHSPNEEDDDSYCLTYAAKRAFRIGVSGFYVNLTSQARRWYRVMARPETFASGQTDEKSSPFADSLTEASRFVMYRSGGYRTLNTVFKHLLAYGFACAIIRPESDEERVKRGRYAVAQCLRVGTYAMGVDEYGNVDRVVRHFAFTAEQLARQFGKDNMPEAVLQALEKGSDQMFETWNLIEPHYKDFRADAKDFRLSYSDFTYRSIYWLNGAQGANNGVLAVRGYKWNPIVAPRLEFEIGDIYGRGRGADSLGMVRGLQTACEDDLDISGQNAQPAVCASEELKEPGVHLGRGGVNFVAPGEQKANAIYRALQEPADATGTRETMARLEQEIKDVYFNNEFASINQDDQNSKVRTATEIEYRKRQSMEQLSGAATTLDDQLLDPFVMAYVRIALDAGLVAIPADFNLSKMDVHYESSVHRAQNAADINSRSESLLFAAEIAKAQASMNDPNTVMDNFDLDKAVRAHHRALGAPEAELLSLELREQNRDERKQQMADAQQAAQEQQAAQILKDQTAAEKQLAEAQAAGGPLAQTMAGIV